MSLKKIKSAESADRQTKPTTSLPEADKSFKEDWEQLDHVEKNFVREALKDGDYELAAKLAGHRNPRELLGRARVRAALLKAAPYSVSTIFAKIVTPYMLEAVQRDALNGDTQSVKLVLSLVKDPPGKKAFDYAQTARTDGSRRTQSAELDSADPAGETSTAGAADTPQ